MVPTDLELGPAMQACSDRERRFVWAYVVAGDGNATQAAREAGYSDPGGDSTAIRVQAHALMHRARVRAAMDEVGRQQFGTLLVPAIRARMRLLENDKHPDHAKAVHQTLEQLGLVAKSQVDVNVSGSVTVNHTDQAVEHLRVLRGLGVPRAKLEEIFGFSGLARYEGMLAELDAKAGGPRLIEGEVVSRE